MSAPERLDCSSRFAVVGGSGFRRMGHVGLLVGGWQVDDELRRCQAVVFKRRRYYRAKEERKRAERRILLESAKLRWHPETMTVCHDALLKLRVTECRRL